MQHRSNFINHDIINGRECNYRKRKQRIIDRFSYSTFPYIYNALFLHAHHIVLLVINQDVPWKFAQVEYTYICQLLRFAGVKVSFERRVPYQKIDVTSFQATKHVFVERIFMFSSYNCLPNLDTFLCNFFTITFHGKGVKST